MNQELRATFQTRPQIAACRLRSRSFIFAIVSSPVRFRAVDYIDPCAIGEVNSRTRWDLARPTLALPAMAIGSGVLRLPFEAAPPGLAGPQNCIIVFATFVVSTAGRISRKPGDR